ncbi:MAG TPA: hypothetical protein DFS52_10590 [Myxococcales bacterium]|nr:hypothetical protein [Myxococcales bacterium]
MASRWDFIQDLKPVPIAEHLIEELAKLFAEDLSKWPLEVEEWSRAADEERFRPLFEPGSMRPDDRVFVEAFRLTRWELEHDIFAVDEYMRNERWRERIAAADYDALIFLYRYLTEQMTAVAEATENRIKRKQLLGCLERMERRMRLRAPSVDLPN